MCVSLNLPTPTCRTFKGKERLYIPLQPIFLTHNTPLQPIVFTEKSSLTTHYLSHPDPQRKGTGHDDCP
ncbi:hypothetical protein HanRHA438_Chr06g0267231 [Helianthus annuus]|nr:hypothetical protein HanRHA438_Chr06g0267231 [Helianthus annuus]